MLLHLVLLPLRPVTTSLPVVRPMYTPPLCISSSFEVISIVARFTKRCHDKKTWYEVHGTTVIIRLAPQDGLLAFRCVLSVLCTPLVARPTHLSLTASCHLCSLAISWTWKPNIRGRYLSALRAADAVLISPMTSGVGSCSSRRLFFPSASALLRT